MTNDNAPRISAGCSQPHARQPFSSKTPRGVNNRCTLKREGAFTRSSAPRRPRWQPLFAANASAFEITTGDPDLQVRWDNTVRYNLGVRAQSQDSKILGNTNFDDGDRNFSNGSIVTNRVDLLSEFDLRLQAHDRLSA